MRISNIESQIRSLTQQIEYKKQQRLQLHKKAGEIKAMAVLVKSQLSFGYCLSKFRNMVLIVQNFCKKLLPEQLRGETIELFNQNQISALLIHSLKPGRIWKLQLSKVDQITYWKLNIHVHNAVSTVLLCLMLMVLHLFA